MDDVDRLPEHASRNEVGSRAHAERGARGEPGDIDGDIGGGVARADHQHALAAEWVGAFVGRGVHDLAGERAWVCRYERVAVVAGADQQAVEALGPCFAVRGHANRPSAIAAKRASLDVCAEADVRLDLKRSCIVGEVGEQLAVRGKIGIVVGHRKVVERRHAPRREGARARMDADPMGIVGERPVAADAAALLVADDVAAAGLKEVLQRRQPAGPRADHADPFLAG